MAELDLDWVALRLVLVYGPGVKGNMAELLRLARSPYPLPLGLLHARRSLLSLDNLVAAVDTVLTAPETAAPAADRGRSQGADHPRNDHGVAPRARPQAGLIPVPPSLLEDGAARGGTGEIYQRLAGSLVADPSALMRLGWTPPVATPDGLAALARS